MQDIAIGTLFTLILAGLATADVLILREPLFLPASLQPQQPGQGIGRQQSPVVGDILQSQGIQTQPSDRPSLLERTLQGQEPVTTVILLKDNDRLGLLSWVESPRSKNLFSALREALLSSLSPSVKDLRDERLTPQDRPPRTELSFSDPALSDEKMTLMRIRDRIYELHVATGREATMAGLIDALTK